MPGKKYRFRKMYFICTDKKVLEDNVMMTNAYQRQEYAFTVLSERGLRLVHKMWEDKALPVPKETVEGFYLVPEALYEEILKIHSKEDELNILKQ